MSVQYIEDKKVFLLNTKHTSYQFRVAEFGFLEHLYYGRKISDTADYLPVRIRHAEEAVRFLDYFYNNPEAQETLKDVRSVPPTSTARSLCADKKLLNPVVVSAVDLAAGLNGKSDKGYTTSAEVYAIQEDMIESVAYGQSTPEDAADNAIDLINDYLSGLK